MINIYNLSLEALKSELAELDIKPYVANQIFSWLYNKLEPEISRWTNISRKNQELLRSRFDTRLSRTEKVETDSSGTRKYLLKLKDGLLIEAVSIRESDHYTFCISSQVGCPLKCAFCATGKMGFFRNLDQAEILSQIILLKQALGDYSQKLNLVFMGMGEPMLNFDNLTAALEIITSELGLNIAQRNITVSTSGFLENIKKLEQAFNKIKISFSLNSPDNKRREILMPVSKKEKLGPILDYFKRQSRKFRITFEYVLIRDLNDSLTDAEKLAKLLSRIPCKINLIPYNENRSIDFKSPDQKHVEAFSEYLYSRGFTVIVRWSKGREIQSACGQLSADNSRYRNDEPG